MKKTDPIPYRFRCETGDLVKMPSGDLAIVTDWDIVCAGHAMEVSLSPSVGFLRRVWLFLTCKLLIANEDIDELELVRPARS